MALLRTISSSVDRSRRRHIALWVVLLALLGGTDVPRSHAQADSSREYELKAVFLFNFAQFVDWPSHCFADTNAPLVIGILGDDPFGRYLDETVHGEKVNGHPLVIQRYSKVDDATHCHILFISPSETKRLDQDLAVLKPESILTVGDMDGFNEQGGIIRFITQKNKIHLHINLEAARTENLTISSRLLRLADIVGARKD